MDKVFSIDPPAGRNLGYCVSKVGKGKYFKIINYGTKIIINNGPEGLYEIYQWLEKFVTKYKINIVVVEDSIGGGMQFLRKKLNEYVGIIKLVAVKNKIEIVEISPKQYKLAVALKGNANKKEVQDAVIKYLKNKDKECEVIQGDSHEFDAIALAIAYKKTR